MENTHLGGVIMLLMSSFSVVDAKGEKFRDQRNENCIKHQTPPNSKKIQSLFLQVVLFFGLT
jgi:hypothetical protein